MCGVRPDCAVVAGKTHTQATVSTAPVHTYSALYTSPVTSTPLARTV